MGLVYSGGGSLCELLYVMMKKEYVPSLLRKNDEGVYRIGKVDFSEEEFETARNLVTGMTS